MPFYASERTGNRGKADGHHTKLRIYQQWQGNERFFCWGHCMAGPNWRSCIGSLLLLLGPTVVFLIWVAWYMGQRVSWAIFVVSCIMPATCVSWLLMTACRDPGVLPRQEPDEEWLSGRKPRTKEVVVNGHPVQVRYNDTCHFYQPPRAHHCSVNDNCIERFDHHCPWVGTTIGQRNYRTFLLFIYGTTIYIMWTFGISLWSFWIKARDLKAAGKSIEILTIIAANPAGVALCVLCFIFFWFVGGLSGFHTFLVGTNQTTYENFSNQRRHNQGSVTNPYDLGLFRNCANVWCTKVPPSKIDFRAFVGEARKAQAAASQRSLQADSQRLDSQRTNAEDSQRSNVVEGSFPSYIASGPFEGGEPRVGDSRTPSAARSAALVGAGVVGGSITSGGTPRGGGSMGQPASRQGSLVGPEGSSAFFQGAAAAAADAAAAGSSAGRGVAALAPERISIEMPRSVVVSRPLTDAEHQQRWRRQQAQQQQQQPPALQQQQHLVQQPYQPRPGHLRTQRQEAG